MGFNEWDNNQNVPANYGYSEGTALMDHPSIINDPSIHEDSRVLHKGNALQYIILFLLSFTSYLTVLAFRHDLVYMLAYFGNIAVITIPTYTIFIGVFVGYLVQGYLSDLLGRKKFMILSLGLQLAALLFSLFYFLSGDMNYPVAQIYNIILGVLAGLGLSVIPLTFAAGFDISGGRGSYFAALLLGPVSYYSAVIIYGSLYLLASQGINLSPSWSNFFCNVPIVVILIVTAVLTLLKWKESAPLCQAGNNIQGTMTPENTFGYNSSTLMGRISAIFSEAAIWAGLFMLSGVAIISAANFRMYYTAMYSEGMFLWLFDLSFLYKLGMALAFTVLSVIMPGIYVKLNGVWAYRILLTVAFVVAGFGIVLCWIYLSVVTAWIELFVYLFVVGFIVPPLWMYSLVLLKNTVFKTETGIALGFGLLTATTSMFIAIQTMYELLFSMAFGYVVALAVSFVLRKERHCGASRTYERQLDFTCCCWSRGCCGIWMVALFFIFIALYILQDLFLLLADV